MRYIYSEVTKTSYLYRLSGSMRMQVMTMDALVVSIWDDKHKPDSIDITWIRMLPDNLYK